jgi:hypothetical protein
VFGFAIELNCLENSVGNTERTAQLLERVASKIGLKTNKDMTKMMKLSNFEDNTNTDSLVFKKVNEF